MYVSSILENNNSGDNMKIKDCMSKKIIGINELASVEAAASKMKEFDIGFLPVIKDQKVVGVVTDRDLVVRACLNQNNFVHEAATKHVISISAEEEITQALALMKEQKIKRLLVVDNQKLVGILSFCDLLNQQVDPILLLETLRSIQEINRNTDYYPTEIDEFYL